MPAKKPRRRSPKHPIQPIVMARDKVVRFHENRIVSWMLKMLELRGVNLNAIAATFDRTGKDRDDYQQLMQLIGYSVSGYGDLSCADRRVLSIADDVASRLASKSKR